MALLNPRKRVSLSSVLISGILSQLTSGLRKPCLESMPFSINYVKHYTIRRSTTIHVFRSLIFFEMDPQRRVGTSSGSRSPRAWFDHLYSFDR